MEKVNISALRFLGLILGLFLITGGLLAQNKPEANENKALTDNIVRSQISFGPNPPITLKLKQVPLKEALKRIAGQARAGLYYNSELLPNKTVSLNLQSVPLGRALREVLEGISLKVVTSGRNITLRQKREPVEMQLPLTTVQEAIGGTVTDAQSGQTLPGVNIRVKGTTTGTSTDANGQYELTVESLQDTLTFSFIGYETQEVPIDGRTDLDVTLTTNISDLDELVVTGVAGGTQRRAVGNEVATVDAVETMQIAPIGNTQDLLGSRIAGVDVSGGSGVLGGGGATRIRGNASVSLSNEPLIYIDGIRVDNNPNAGPDNTRQGRTASRMNDLNAENIKSLDVIKGPAAATLYGTEASNGVIQIVTKKGKVGKPQLNVMLRSGFNSLLGAKRRLPNGYRRAPDGSGDLLEWNIYTQENEKGELNNTFLQNGLVQSYSANLEGGTEAIRYFVAGRYDDSEGFIPWNNRGTSNIRANIDVYPNEEFHISANIGYNTGDTRFAQVEAPYGIWDSAVWGHTDRRANLGFYTTPPGVSPDNIELRSDIKRVTWSVNISNNPTNWLEQRLVVGQDFSTELNTQVYKRLPPSSRQYFGGASKGKKYLEDVGTTYNSFDYSATGKFDFSRNFRMTPSVGVQYYSKETKRSSAVGREFPSRNIESIGGAAVTTASESFVPNKTLGGYFQNRLSWKNRLFLTLAVRGDDNSAFGTNFQAIVYPKASMAWVISDEPFFNQSWISSLRFRGAYGQSGQQPDVFAATKLYNPATGPGNVPVITPDNKGNPDLGPEKGVEIEAGFDAELLNNINISLTYYDQKTKDAILARQLPLSSGFPGAQFVNIGEVSNKGVEFEIDGDVIQNSNLNWNLGGTFAWNKGELIDLGNVPETENLYTSLKEGYPLYGYWGVEIVDAELDENNEVIMSSIMCKQPDGSPKPCTESAPRIYQGPQTPKFQGSVNTNISFLKNWIFYANIDYKFGHFRGDGDVGFAHMLMSDTKATVGSPIGEGVLETETIPDVGDMVYRRYSESTGPNPIAKAYATDPSGWGNNLFIHNAGFVRLRELSLRYNLPKDWGQRLGLSNASITASGKNLWFLYRVQNEILGRRIVDPEISRSDGFEGQTQTTLPLMSSFILTLRIDI